MSIPIGERAMCQTLVTSVSFLILENAGMQAFPVKQFAERRMKK
jgi:hypothetical protein